MVSWIWDQETSIVWATSAKSSRRGKKHYGSFNGSFTTTDTIETKLQLAVMISTKDNLQRGIQGRSRIWVRERVLRIIQPYSLYGICISLLICVSLRLDYAFKKWKECPTSLLILFMVLACIGQSMKTRPVWPLHSFKLMLL